MTSAIYSAAHRDLRKYMGLYLVIIDERRWVSKYTIRFNLTA